MSNASHSPKGGSAKTDTMTRRSILTTAAGLGAAAVAGPAAAQAAQASDEFTGKTAFVTGGARGIGYACAEALARGGANIVLFDIAEQIPEVPYPLASEADLASAKSKIDALGVGCIAIQGDVRDGAAQQAAVDRALAEFGSLDFAIANAGITQIGPLASFTDAEMSLVLDINLKGVIKTVQAVTPAMQEQNSGRIVLMSSVTGRTGSPNFPIYSASKWGVIGIAKSTAMALGQSNVICNAVCPTLVHTGLLDNSYILSNIVPGQTLTFEQFNEAAKSRHMLPVGLYEPSRVGDCVRFLCSESSAMISGDVVDIGAGANAQFPA
ncbi:SDR family NAD(P)-dependent oxidoreductase [Bauldia sp.]|uniref:SDR family NAD(P)-dependent oxidoreductase n=1 Tax=Bauldia sp. TaxID=2575872 RepID=UPI003BAB3170